MKIEFPNLYEVKMSIPNNPHFKECLTDSMTYGDFKRWFTEHVTPVNEMLAEGITVYSNKRQEPEHFFTSKHCGPQETHKALLINIQPIKQETAEDVLRELIKTYETLKRQAAVDVSYYVDKARAILDRKGEV